MQGADASITAPIDHILQRRAEDQDLLELADASLDDWVPEPVLRDFCTKVLHDCRKLLTNLDLHSSVLQEAAAMEPVR